LSAAVFCFLDEVETYRTNPFTVFYLGSSSGYEYFDRNDYAGLNDSQWKLSEQHFFARFQYLFRI
jgi:hypothetical protein